MSTFPYLVRTIFMNTIRAKLPVATTGRPRTVNLDVILDYIWLILRTGMQWRLLPCKDMSMKTVFSYFQKWKRANIFSEVYKSLLRLHLHSRKPRYCIIDTSFVKNVYGCDCTGRNPTDRGRKASKVSIVVDDTGIPCALSIFAANIPDCTTLKPTLEHVMCELPRNLPLLSDKGYDSHINRIALKKHGFLDRIGRKRHKIGKRQNRKRTTVEHTFAWLDQYRRLKERFDKMVSSYEAFTLFALATILGKRLQN